MRVLIVLIFSGWLWAQAPAPAGDPKSGRVLFEKDGCYECHGYQAQGGAAGARLAPKPIVSTAFSKYVRHPTGQMPPYTAKVLSDHELADVYAFLQSIPVPKAASDIPLLKR
jgi:mono/diheme cytochrome c family protein